MARLSVFEDEAREWAQRSKTTLLTHLATALAASGKVLLIDADPQGSALDWQAQRKAAAGFPVVGLPKPCCTLAPVRSADSTCQRPRGAVVFHNLSSCLFHTGPTRCYRKKGRIRNRQ